MEKRTNNLIFTKAQVPFEKTFREKHNFNKCYRINFDVVITNKLG